MQETRTKYDTGKLVVAIFSRLKDEVDYFHNPVVILKDGNRNALRELKRLLCEYFALDEMGDKR